MFTIYTVLGVLALAIIWAIIGYNGLVRLRQQAKEAESDIDVQLKRRFDLIPNLVATVQGYASHERETLTAVTEARAKVGQITAGGMQKVLEDPQAFAKFQAAQGELTQALSRLMVVVERYPDLKANENFLDLQRQLEGTENRITVERKRFNEVAQQYNTSIRLFPGALVAGFSGFKEKAYFQAQEGAAQAPKVQFGTPAPATP